MHLPVELLVIGAAIISHQKQVTSKEVDKYAKRCNLPLEYDSANELYYCDYDEEKDTYTIKDDVSLPPYVLQLLTNM